ncbi:MAG: Intrarane protease RasP/YluC, implicated in cell division based on FtsL cleavage [Labilithrix sp.]|nr:Intrarane protease RasP/YluC, implicated in cell division based on FtsL cleavage [Labilithrix sp.]
MYFLLAIVTLAAGGAIALSFAATFRWLVSLPFGARSFREAYGTSRADAPPPSTALAFSRALAGIAGWYVASSLLFGCALFSSGEVRVDEEHMRVRVAVDGPAARAGVRDHDRIIAVDGAEVRDWDGLRSAVASHVNETVHLDLERDGQRLTLEVKPEGTPAKILVGPETLKEDVGLGRAFVTGVVEPAKVSIALVRGIAGMLVTGDTPESTGPVGVVKETAAAQRQGFGTAVKLVALLLAYVMPYFAVLSLFMAFMAARRRPINRGRPPRTSG